MTYNFSLVQYFGRIIRLDEFSLRTMHVTYLRIYKSLSVLNCNVSSAFSLFTFKAF